MTVFSFNRQNALLVKTHLHHHQINNFLPLFRHRLWIILWSTKRMIRKIICNLIFKKTKTQYLHQMMNQTLISTLILWQKNLPKNFKKCPKTNQTSPIDKIKIVNLSTCLMNWFSMNQLTVSTAVTFSTSLTEKLISKS